MDGIAQAPREERAELFRRSAPALRPARPPAIMEKDFWVCWTLHRIYDVLQFRPQMIFKGGTSLSKAYDAIARFDRMRPRYFLRRSRWPLRVGHTF